MLKKNIAKKKKKKAFKVIYRREFQQWDLN